MSLLHPILSTKKLRLNPIKYFYESRISFELGLFHVQLRFAFNINTLNSDMSNGYKKTQLLGLCKITKSHSILTA